MDVINKMLIKFFPLHKYQSQQTQTKAVTITVAYLFGVVKLHTFNHNLKHLEKNTLGYRKEIMEFGYIVKNLKLYLYSCYLTDSYKKYEEAKKIGKEYGIDKCDIKLAKILENPTINSFLNQYSLKYKALSLSCFDKAITKIYQDTETYTIKFIHKKLRFILSASSLSNEDISNELRFRGLQAVMVMYPRIDNLLHALNISKKAIHNQGINLIHKFCTKKRKILVMNPDNTFSSTLFSIDLLDFDVTASNKIEDNISITQLTKKYGGKKQKFVKILSGTLDSDFSEWLNLAKVSVHDNVHLQENMYRLDKTAKFISIVCRYLDISEVQGRKFLDKLGTQLGEKI